MCDVPNSRKTTKSSNSTLFGDTLEYECLEGYIHIAGELRTTCMENASWSGMVPVCQRKMHISV